MIYDITERVAAAWEYYDKILDKRIEQIEAASGVSRERFVKINPLEFVEKNPFQEIRDYEYKRIGKWIGETKTDENFLISPLDDIELTANQISYKRRQKIEKTLRASKCDVLPIPRPVALDFFIRNHRQSTPQYRKYAICYGLVNNGELVAVMQYDRSNSAVRGRNRDYELVRFAVRHGYKIHGGASKLQKACEQTLREMGETRIYSYSNATINTGAVYKQLGFTGSHVQDGQPHVLLNDNKIVRLIRLYPNTTVDALALRGHIKVYFGGNRKWVKEI